MKKQISIKSHQTLYPLSIIIFETVSSICATTRRINTMNSGKRLN